VIAALEAAEHLFQRRIIAAGEAQSLSPCRFEKASRTMEFEKAESLSC
jgi:hypothetical protein